MTSAERAAKIAALIEQIQDVRRELGECALALGHAEPGELPATARILLRSSSDTFEVAEKLIGLLLP